ncbi:MAG: hypothetical protein ACRCVA_09735 [Phreatobacter sp.]
MAITLRNKKVEDQIHRLARRWRKGPSAVIAEAVERAAAADEAGQSRFPSDEIARRKLLMENFLQDMAENSTDDDRKAARDIAKTLHDDDGLPI